jgi:peptidoglycan-N-acetylglucosamine deacetylase
VNEGARVVLTFDAEHPDRPASPQGNAERILDELGAAGVRATFFVQSRWAKANPDLARRIAEDGHVVGNHSAHHAPMTMMSDEGLRREVERAGETLHELTGADPRPWFRCPFGDGHDDPRVLRALSGLGYRNVHWDVETEDWEPWRSAADIARDAVEGAVAHGDGAVVLLHTWPSGTAAAVPLALARFAEAGVRFATVDELEALP